MKLSFANKKMWIMMLFIFKMHYLFADGITIEVSPKNPVKNESFTVLFKINTTSNNEPYISFSPLGVEVQGRTREGVSVQATMINGKFRTKRELIYRYEMIATKSGVSKLKDIEVQLGDQTIRHPTLLINVLDKARALRPMFLVAEVSNPTPYLGEGVDLRYYLYSKYPILGQEVKAFPKLNGFIKRFHQIPDNEETVEYQGEIYRRSLKYSARVFPEKTGTLYIDSLYLIVQFAAGTRGSPFGGFGFQTMRKRELSNAKVKLEVKPLPAINVPLSFSGLVGDHDFKVEVSRNKYLVNQAVELRLIVEGEGLLESYEAPILYKNPNLEEFDTKSEVREINQARARKTFDYTYLARGAFVENEKKVEISYFNPKRESYETKEILLPPLTVAGSSSSGNTTNLVIPPKGESRSGDNESQKIPYTGTHSSMNQSVVAPLFEETLVSKTLGRLSLVLYSFALVVFIQLCELFASRFFAKREPKSEAESLYRNLKKKGLDFHLFHQFIFSKREKGLKGNDAKDLILSSPLGKNDKEYLLKVLEYLENKVYSDTKKPQRVTFKDSVMKKWVKI